MDTTNKLAEEPFALQPAVNAFIGALSETYSAQQINDAFAAIGYIRATPSADQATQPAEAELLKAAHNACRHFYEFNETPEALAASEFGRAMDALEEAVGRVRDNALQALVDDAQEMGLYATHPAPASASEPEWNCARATGLDKPRCDKPCGMVFCGTASASEPACKTCGGTRLVPDGYLYGEGGVEFSEPIACTKDCPDCASASVAGAGDAHTCETCEFAETEGRDYPCSGCAIGTNSTEHFDRWVAIRVDDTEDDHTTIMRLGGLLEAVARAVRGEPPKGIRWGYADLPDRVTAVVNSHALLAAALAARPVATQKGEK